MQKEKILRIGNQEYRLIRSSRKSIGLQVRNDGQVIIRAPYRMSEYTIKELIAEKTEWIERSRKKLEEQKTVRDQERRALTEEERTALVQEACRILPERTAYFAQKMQVTYGRITIRDQKTRWGSCSSKGNLNFNFRLVMAPSEILDYVVVHELCHRKVMNHSAEFWSEVERILPDYRTRRQWLKENGWRLMG